MARKRKREMGTGSLLLLLGGSLLLLTVGPNLILAGIARLINPSGMPVVDSQGNPINYFPGP